MDLLKRKIDGFLAKWKENPDRKPLIVKGARQVGKTISIRAFGQTNYESVIEINFVLQKKFRSIFYNGYEVDTIIKNISLMNLPGGLFHTRRSFFLTSCRNTLTAPHPLNRSMRIRAMMSFVLVP